MKWGLIDFSKSLGVMSTIKWYSCIWKSLKIINIINSLKFYFFWEMLFYSCVIKDGVLHCCCSDENEYWHSNCNKPSKWMSVCIVAAAEQIWSDTVRASSQPSHYSYRTITTWNRQKMSPHVWREWNLQVIKASVFNTDKTQFNFIWTKMLAC